MIIKELAKNGTIGFLAADALPNDYQNVSYFLIGDDGLAFRETIMKPYSLWGLNHDEDI